MPSALLRFNAVSAVIFSGIFGCVLFAVALAVSPSLALLDGPHYAVVKQEQIKIFQVAMSVISTLYTVQAIAILVMARGGKYPQLFRLTLISLVLVIAALLYSVPTDITYNSEIMK